MKTASQLVESRVATLYEQVAAALADAVEEGEEALELLRNRTFARRLH